MDISVLISKFPPEWQGLFATLNHPERALLHAELWLTENQRSQYGERASWGSFIKALCNNEPCSEGQDLIFKPRLLHMPVYLQRKVLAFIHHHRTKFPASALNHLLEHVNTQQLPDDWTQCLLGMIQRHCESLKPSGHHQSVGGSIPTSSSQRSGCSGPTSPTLLENLYEKLRIKTPTLPRSNPWTSDPLLDGVSKDKSKHSEQQVKVVDSIQRVEKEEKDIEEIIIEQCFEEPMVIEIDASPKKIQTRKHRMSSGSDNGDLRNEMPTKKIKLDPNFTSSPPLASSRQEGNLVSPLGDSPELELKMSTSSDSNALTLENDILDKVDKLKESWTNGLSADQKQMQVFSICNQNQIELIWKRLELGKSSELVICTSCTQMISQSQTISYSSALGFTKTSLLPHVLALNQNATRSLQSCIIQFTQTFPKPTIEGLLVPCSVQENINTHHVDLLSRAIQEALSNELQNDFVSLYFKQSNPLTESFLSILQLLIDRKLILTSDNVNVLVRSCEQNSLNMCKNLKFGKLILAIINKYSNEFTLHTMSSLRQTIETNKTFLKKSCLIALNKVNI